MTKSLLFTQRLSEKTFVEVETAIPAKLKRSYFDLDFAFVNPSNFILVVGRKKGYIHAFKHLQPSTGLPNGSRNASPPDQSSSKTTIVHTDLKGKMSCFCQKSIFLL